MRSSAQIGMYHLKASNRLDPSDNDPEPSYMISKRDGRKIMA